ncbi:hypothetical protein O2N63_03025 [Aliiroseovarius sp. KMU-50]|uniref:3-deoxy-D-manno-octulosonic acid transferase n=1 Tax=Aliiroseovarius salicola TaxID=3009082 RepID=A0ABT4VXQ9_9RHOB|nr:glycosyltransferase N-terminal domain-containing protein [Aliiroseovarius sp. KMU-50]MDA5093050.1 hypothetical protein [Aliiroseovarius sp. KMU-50]
MLPPGVYVHQLVHRLKARKAHLRPEPQKSPRPEGGPLIWCHVGTLGDLHALEDFIRQLIRTRDDLCFLITRPDDCSASPPAEDLKDFVLPTPLPRDNTKSVVEFLDHWRPDLLLWMEQKFEVTLLAETHRRAIPAIWINARSPLLGQPPLTWLRSTARALASGFDTLLAENETCAAALSRLGVPSGKLKVAGVLQKQTQPPSCNMAERDDVANILAGRPVWLALGVSSEEDLQVVSAHRHVMRKSHRLLLVLVPDECERAPDLAKALERDGWVVGLRSEGADPTADIHIYIADLPQEEGLWMHLSPITLIGHTMSGGMCMSPNIAASLGSVVLYGSRLDQHAAAFARLDAAGAAVQVKDEAALAAKIEYLLQPEHAAEIAMAAWEITTSGAELSSLVEDLVLTALDDQKDAQTEQKG